jgi:hypothetical protein
MPTFRNTLFHLHRQVGVEWLGWEMLGYLKSSLSWANNQQVMVDCVWNVMAHAQKPDFVFRGNGRVHLNRRGRQFSRLLAGELCTSACRVCTARASQCSAVVWRLLVTHPTLVSPFTSPVRLRVPSHFNWALLIIITRPSAQTYVLRVVNMPT